MAANSFTQLATFPPLNLSAGAYNLFAHYVGNATFPPSDSSLLLQNVAQTTTSTVLNTSVNPSYPGEPVTFQAVVNGLNTTVSQGTVNLIDNGTGQIVESAPLVWASGSTQLATFAPLNLSAASYNFFAYYVGDAPFAPSASPLVNQIVAQTTTTTFLASSSNPSNAGQAVTFQASVGGFNTTVSQGTVNLIDNGTGQIVEWRRSCGRAVPPNSPRSPP